MKKIRSYYFAMLAIAGFSFLTSCGGEDEPNPKAEITFNPAAESISLAPGDSVNALKISVTSADKLKSFTITKSGASTPLVSVTSFPGAGYSTTLRDIVDANKAEGDQIIYTITATTKQDEVTTRTYTVKVNTIATYTAKILGNQNATSGSFFSSTDGTVLNSNDAKANSAKVDLVYYYSVGGTAATDLATLASPMNANAQAVYGSTTTANIPSWATKNDTKFKKLPAAQSNGVYEGFTSGAQIQQGYTALPAAEGSSATKLAVNDVVGFKTAAGKYGVAKVTAVTLPTTGNGNKSEITLSIKMQR